MELPSVLNAKDIAAYLQVSNRYAYELMDMDDFPTLTFGKRSKRVKREDFLKWVEGKKQKIS